MKNWFITPTLTLINIFEFMNPELSKYITGLRKNHNNQQGLLKMSEIWRSKLNYGNKIGALTMDWPKAFDTTNHDILTRKLCLMY